MYAAVQRAGDEFTIASQYKPHAKQLAFHSSQKRFVVLAAGIRGGKTISATVELLRRIYADVAAGKGKLPAGTGRKRQPRLLYWVVAPTSDLGVHVHRYIHQFVPHGLIDRTYEDAVWLKPDVLIEFKSAERPERLVGASVCGMLVDEACRVKAESWRGALRGRLADTGGFALFASSPLGGRSNWVHQELVAKVGTDPQMGAFHWTTADNPHIDPAEIEHARATQPLQWFRRDWEASWDSFGGSVYEEFTEDCIISEATFRLEYGAGSAPLINTKKIFRRVVCGADFGWTSPGAMVVVGHIGDSSYVILDEVYEPALQISGKWSRTWLSEAMRLREKWGVDMFLCDPSRPDAIEDLRMNGVPAIAAWNDIHMGIRRVSEGLHTVNGRPGMRILDNCKNLITEMRSYMWKPTKDQGGFMEVPADGQADHACDALRYAVVELRPYADVRARSYASAATQRFKPVG